MPGKQARLVRTDRTDRSGRGARMRCPGAPVLCLSPPLVALLLARFAIRSGQSHPGLYARNRVACTRSLGLIRIRPPHSPGAPRVACAGVSPRRRGLLLPYDLLRYLDTPFPQHSHFTHLPIFLGGVSVHPRYQARHPIPFEDQFTDPTAFPHSVLVSLDFPSVVSVAAARFFRKCYKTTAAAHVGGVPVGHIRHPRATGTLPAHSLIRMSRA